MNQGGFTAFLGSNVLPAWDEVFVELYENAFTDPQFYTYHFTLPTSLFGAAVDSPVPWQDLEGILEFTVASGSMTLTGLEAREVRDTMLYQADIPLAPAPVPSSAAVLAVGVTASVPLLRPILRRASHRT